MLMLSASVIAAPVIDSVQQMSTVCTGTGKLTVWAHGSGTLSYTIISGPVTRGAQSNKSFYSLPAGTYTVEVTDGSGATTTTTATVSGGSYTPMTYTTSVEYPICKMTHRFYIINHLTPGTGLAPFSWQLSGNGVNTPYQSSDTFIVTDPGSYTITCSDACGNIVTNNFSFQHTFQSNIINGGATQYLKGCDSMVVDMRAWHDFYGDTLVFPLTLILTQHGAPKSFTQPTPVYNTVVTHGSSSFWADAAKVDMTSTVRHTRGDTIYAMMVDGCQDTITSILRNPVHDTLNSSTWNYDQVMIGPCHPAYATYVPYSQSRPNTWTVVNNTTHATAASGQNAYDPTNMSDNAVQISDLTANASYTFLSIDACGDTVSARFVWPQFYPSLRHYTLAAIGSCLDHTAQQSLLYSGFTSGVTLEILRGPSGASSTTPGFEYTQHYSYPKVFHTRAADTLTFSDLAEGHYVYRISDSCGNSVTDSFGVLTPTLMNYEHQVSYKIGCNNTSSIRARYAGLDTFFSRFHATCTITDAATGAVLSTSSNNLNTLYGTATNLAAGTYIVSAQFYDLATGYSMADVPFCNHVVDTIVIPAYIAPALASVTGSDCSGSLTINATPDTATGVKPYSYAIISGPQTAAAQSGTSFSVQHFGTYTVQISDACGNNSTMTVTIDSLTSGPQKIYSKVDSCFRAMVRGQVYTAPAVVLTNVQGVSGCDSIVYIDSVFIRGSNDVLPVLNVADTFCAKTGGAITAVPSYVSYVWADGTTARSLAVSQAGSYTISATDAEGCIRVATDLVAFTDSPYITSGWVTDTAVCIDAPLNVNLTVNDNNAHFIWEGAPQYGLTRAIMDSGVYLFTISNLCASTNYLLTARGKECAEVIYVPNAFSPNGDGINDLFQVYPDYKLKLTRIQIFDRWGEMVYDGDDALQGWDGSYKGTPQSTGVYIYQIDALWPTGKVAHVRGSLTLIR